MTPKPEKIRSQIPQAGRRLVEDFWEPWIAAKKTKSKAGTIDLIDRVWRIHDNPCEDIALPRMIPKKHIYLGVDQLLALADASGWHRPIVLTLGLCGLRWGELVGLQVGDVDFARQRIHVLRTVSEIRDHFVVGTTKTGETRTVIFPSLLRPCLEEACAGRRPSNLLFPGRRMDATVATGSAVRSARSLTRMPPRR